jgi:putative transposase
MIRQSWIDTMDETLPVAIQCDLAGVCRSTIYARQKSSPVVDAGDLLLSRLIDEEYTRHPFYGSRKMLVYLRTLGHDINRKRVQRLMREMGLFAMAPGPQTSQKHPEHRIYPYLLRGMEITKPNQVWGTDITYIRLNSGFAYLVVMMDWYSRKVLSWRVSNTMDASFCVDCLDEALRIYGAPDIANSDQGAQFTSEAYTATLLRNGIAISMDGRGRAFDNIFVERLWRSVKHEDVYIKGYETMRDLVPGLSDYFAFYNTERPHQSLGQQTPDVVYWTKSGGGALIIDKYGRNKEESTREQNF